MSVDLFAGLPVRDYARAVGWYTQLLGGEPAFLPHPAEAVWEVAEHCFLYVVLLPERAGHAVHTLFVDDLDARLAAVGSRGLEPSREETYDNGVRKVTFRDPDGNEVSLAGAAAT